MNALSIILLVAVAVCFAAAVRHIVRNKRKFCGGCCGDCSACDKRSKK